MWDDGTYNTFCSVLPCVEIICVSSMFFTLAQIVTFIFICVAPGTDLLSQHHLTWSLYLQPHSSTPSIHSPGGSLLSNYRCAIPHSHLTLTDLILIFTFLIILLLMGCIVYTSHYICITYMYNKIPQSQPQIQTFFIKCMYFNLHVG